MLFNLGNLCTNTSKDLQAINYYQETLAIFDLFLSPDHLYIIELLEYYSELLLKLNRNNEAQPLLDRIALLNLSD